MTNAMETNEQVREEHVLIFVQFGPQLFSSVTNRKGHGGP
jgi:hypothetical protein